MEIVKFVFNDQPLPFKKIYSYERIRPPSYKQDLADQIAALKFKLTQVEPKKEQTTRPLDTYQRNMEWQQRVNQKRERLRQEAMQKEKQELNSSERKVAISNLLTSLRVLDHEGPIKGWQKNVQKYFQKKNALPEPLQFKPHINELSRSIMRRVGRKEQVEDRLLKIGQKATERKLKLKEKIERQMEASKVHSKVAYDPDVFQKLFLEAQNKMIRLENIQQQNVYPFQPAISQVDQSLVKKSQERRERRKMLQEEQYSVQEKKLNRSELESFLKRNYPPLKALSQKANREQLKLTIECIPEPIQQQASPKPQLFFSNECSSMDIAEAHLLRGHFGSLDSSLSQDSLEERMVGFEERINQVLGLEEEELFIG